MIIRITKKNGANMKVIITDEIQRKIDRLGCLNSKLTEDDEYSKSSEALDEFIELFELIDEIVNFYKAELIQSGIKIT